MTGVGVVWRRMSTHQTPSFLRALALTLLAVAPGCVDSEVPDPSPGFRFGGGSESDTGEPVDMQICWDGDETVYREYGEDCEQGTQHGCFAGEFLPPGGNGLTVCCDNDPEGDPSDCTLHPLGYSCNRTRAQVCDIPVPMVCANVNWTAGYIEDSGSCDAGYSYFCVEDGPTLGNSACCDPAGECVFVQFGGVCPQNTSSFCGNA